ncbi:MAG TPA: sigma factor G inhibitor Gin [Verrucomicrobiae bacterium]|nr:sigma factor G inhibitor Gin [Verrucomicrobiae bacterium]
MAGKLLPVCIICGETPLLGIADGVVLRGKFLCADCEKEILDLDVESNDYEEVVEKLKSIWEYKA